MTGGEPRHAGSVAARSDGVSTTARLSDCLTVILGNVTLVKQACAATPRIVAMLDDVESAAQTMAHVVCNQLTRRPGVPHSLRPIELHTLVSASRAGLTALTPEPDALIFDLQPATVRGEPALLRDAAAHLLRNAVRTARLGAICRVRTESRHIPAARSEREPGLLAPGQYAVLSVEVSVGRAGGGAGDGRADPAGHVCRTAPEDDLAVVLGIARVHDGTVVVRSTPQSSVVDLAIPTSVR